MPRIDPYQLIKCLSVLLTLEGGILSREVVPRLVNLMTKFSKKLVSKCVYVLILKNTDTELVDMFMAEGGWTLIQMWLQDAVQTANWDLVKEILGLLLITPVDVERLKLNILPKLIKSLSRREELDGVAKLSTQLVQQWLAIVKGSSSAAIQQQQQAAVAAAPPEAHPPVLEPEPVSQPEAGEKATEDKENNSDSPEENAPSIDAISAAVEEPEGETVVESKEEQKKSESSESKSSSRSSSSKSSSRDKDKDRKRSSSRDSSSRSRSKSSRDKDRKDRDKHRSSSSSTSKSSSKSSSKDSKERRDSKDKDKDKDKHPEKDKEKQAEKDKDTLSKIKPQSVDKLGRIPKKPIVEEKPKESKDKDLKKKSFSVGIRKDSEERPKTVKVFNSKMRSTGLEEEIKPAPPRSVKKPTPSVQLPTIPTKRPSPPRDHRDPVTPPEKKLKIDKIDVPERPGAIKLIPPKPKPAMLQESDLFMDALTASATAKKEPKKRKRRASVTKESQSSPSSSPAREQPQTPTSPSQTTPSGAALGLKNIAPINFYQDTLKTEENAESVPESKDNENKENAAENNAEAKGNAGEEDKDTPASPTTPTDDTNGEEVIEAKKPKLDGGLKGVLLYTKKKGPKRSISWKNESDLVEIRYFELDETERVNVTKTFGDMAKMEMNSEREALQMSRKVVGEDTMEAQRPWRLPFMVDFVDDPTVQYGYKSLEKDIQFAREKSVLQALYFDKRRVPDSAEEPIPENHQMSDPIQIPLEDPDTQEIDLRNTPWPEPKGSPPHIEPQIPLHIFPTVPGPFTHPFNNMPPPQFQGMPPRFPGQAAPVGNPGPMGPANFIPPNIMPNGNMMGPPSMGPPNELMNQGPMNQNMFPPGPVHDGYGPGPGPGPGPDFNPMYNQNNMNMYPPNNFNNHRPGNRGGYRRGGGNAGNWVRMGGPGNWKRGGGGHRGGRLCKNVQNHGYCRNRDNCPFVHP